MQIWRKRVILTGIQRHGRVRRHGGDVVVGILRVPALVAEHGPLVVKHMVTVPTAVVLPIPRHLGS